MIITEKWACKSKPEKFDYNGIAVPPERYAFLYDVKLGPLELGDSQERVDRAIWMASVEDNKVYLYKATGMVWSAPTLLVELSAGITDLALGFDALGQAVLFYAEGSVLKLWYFNSQLGQLVTQIITTNGKTPLIDFDRRANTSDPTSDVAIFYVENNSAYMRLQRDVYEVPYHTGVTQLGLRLLNCGMNVGNRFQVTYSYQDAQDGSNTTLKSIETINPIVENMKGNNLEIRYTVAKAPTYCQLKKSYVDGIGALEFFNQIEHTIVCHQGGVDAALQEDFLFSLSIQGDYAVGGGDPDVVHTLIRGGGFNQYYWVGDLPFSVFGIGDFILRFTNHPPETEGSAARKRVEFIKNGVSIVDEIVYDTDSVIATQGVSAGNGLRFGARANGNNTQLYGLTLGYYYIYPAVYTDIEVTLNGVTTVWDKGYSDNTVIPSVPVGNNIHYRTRGDVGHFFTRQDLLDYMDSFA